jgi:threonine/homoserine/homoserine lactone efflux protein
MVILILTTMLILSAAIPLNAVQPVLGAVVVFGPLYLIYMAACVLSGYAKVRARSSTHAQPLPSHLARPTVLNSRVPAPLR